MSKLRYIFILLAVALMAGCQDRQRAEEGGAQGEVSCSVETDVKAQIYNVSTRVGETPTYRLTIYKGTEVVQSYEDYTKIERLRLVAGKYRFVVESGSDMPIAIDAPYFRGEQEVIVTAGETVKVTVSAKLANVRVSSSVSQIIKDNFKEYTLKVSYSTTQDEQTFEHTATLSKADITEGRSIYMSSTQKSFVWTLTMVNNQGTVANFYSEVRGVESCTHYKFDFDIDNTADADDGQLMLTLIVDSSVDHKEEDIDISLEKKELPYMSPKGSFKLDEQNVVNEVVRGAQFIIDLYASAGIKELKIRHSNEQLRDEKAVPFFFRPTAIEASVIQAINAAGIWWSMPISAASYASVNFTDLAAVAPLGEYKFYITLTDNENQVVEHTLHFVVLPDQDHITKTAEYGAKYAILKGEWCTLQAPELLSFQYRADGSADWIIVEPNLVQMEEGTKNYSVRIKGLSPTTKYVYRTYSPAAGDKQGQEMNFTTFAAPEIPNLNFDQAYSSGEYWYPNASGGNSYWATGNDGIVAGPVSMSSNNTEELTDVVKKGGKAVRLRSVRINYGLSPVKFAGGSIFTGTYSTDMMNPINSVRFGRQYKGRPLALKGWYKYTPQIINNDKNGVAGDEWGKLDKCHIYISLEDWGSATSRPGSPRIIGYGELKSNEKVTEYREFYIPIEYKDPLRTPTHVVMAATASHLGGNFCGADGSEMLIDEFALVWE